MRELIIARGFVVERARYRSAVASYVIRGGEAGKARLAVLSAALLGPIALELEAFCAEPDTIVALPRIFQVFGRRPG